MKDKRAINLDLTTIHFPIPAIISIIHRISGVLLFLAIPFVLYFFQQSLYSVQAFNELKLGLNQPWFKVFVWIFTTGLMYHLIAGIRHLIMDLGVGESKQGGRCGAWVVLILTLIVAILIGIKLW